MGNKWKVKNARRFIHGTGQGRANPSGLAKQGMQDKIQKTVEYIGPGGPLPRSSVSCVSQTFRHLCFFCRKTNRIERYENVFIFVSRTESSLIFFLGARRYICYCVDTRQGISSTVFLFLSVWRNLEFVIVKIFAFSKPFSLCLNKFLKWVVLGMIKYFFLEIGIAERR